MSDCAINPLTGRAIKKSGATYKQLEKKKNKVGVLENVIKAKKDKEEYDEKKKAGTVLQAVVKRKLTKKPAPKPAPAKKFGFEDLDEGVKDMISGMVKKNKNRKDMIKDAKEKLKGYKLPGYTKLSNEELYDWVYGGKLDEAVKKLARTNYEKEMKSSFNNLFKEKDINWRVDYMDNEDNYRNNIDTSKKDGFDLLSFLRRNEDNVESVDAYLDVNRNKYLLYRTYNDEGYLFEIIPKNGSRLSAVFDTDGWTTDKIEVLKYSMKEFLKREKFKINGFKISYLPFLEWFKNEK